MERRPVKRAIAVHEAGHAVVGVVLGAKVDSVTIIPTWHACGSCFVDTSTLSSEHARMVNLAGDTALHLFEPHLYPILQSYLRGEAHMKTGRLRNKLNTELASIGVAELTDAEADAAIPDTQSAVKGVNKPDQRTAIFTAVTHAVDVLERHRLALSILTDELMLVGTVTGQRVVEIVRGAWRKQAA